MKAELLIKNIGMLATATGSSAKAGKEQGEISIQENVWVAVNDGKIAEIGSGEPAVEAEEEATDAAPQKKRNYRRPYYHRRRPKNNAES